MPERFTDVIGIISGVLDAVQYHHAKFEADEVIAMGEKEAVVSIFVGGLVKTYDGRRGLSGSVACRWYINEDLHDINVIRNRLRNGSSPVQRIVLQGQTADEVAAQDGRFFCTATLTGLSPAQRWWFSSCTVCHRSSSPVGAVYKCSDPNCSGTNAIQRYRICYKAVDDTNEIEFVFFDRVGRELIGTPLISLLRHGHPPAMSLSELIESVRGEISIPRELLAIVSRKFRFVVSISKKCFTKEGSDLSFLVLRIDGPLGKVATASVFYRGSHSASRSASTGGAVQSEDPLLPPTLPSPSATTSDLSVQRPVNTPTNTGPIDTAATDLFSPRGQAQVTLPGTPASVAKPPPKGITHSGVKTNAKRALMNDKTFAAGLPEDLAGPADDDVHLADMTNTKKRGGPVLSKVTSPDGGKKPKE